MSPTPPDSGDSGATANAAEGGGELDVLNARQLTAKINNAKNPSELLRLHLDYGSAFDAIHISVFWNRIKKLAGRPRSLERAMFQKKSSEFAPFCALTGELLPDIHARGLSMIAHSLATAGLHGGQPWALVWETLLPHTVAKLDAFNPQELANTAWAFATAGQRASQLFDALAAEVVQRSLSDFNEQALSNIVWAFATAGHLAHPLFDAVAIEAAARLDEFTPQALANTAWAFANNGIYGHAAPMLFDELAAEAIERLDSFTPQALANTAWAFATAGEESPKLFEAMAEEIVGRGMHEFNSQALANTVWAFATLGAEAPEFFDALAAEVVSRQLAAFKPQELSNVAWSFAKADIPAPHLFDAIAAEAVKRLGPSRDEAQPKPRAAPGAAIPARAWSDEFAPQNLSNMAWAYATAMHASPSLFAALAAEAAERVEELNSQDLANMAWAFAVFDDTSGTRLFSLPEFAEHCDESSSEFTSASLAQLHQWELWRNERGDQWPSLAPMLRARCRVSFIVNDKESANPSQMQKRVTEQLRSLFWGMESFSVHEEVRCDSGYSIDVVVDDKKQGKVGVEVDGPSHFIGETQRHAGATELKHRQLRHHKWKLITVPYWEWTALKVETEPMAMSRYLRKKLAEVDFKVPEPVEWQRPEKLECDGESSKRRQLNGVAGALSAGSDEEAWTEAWNERIGCWFIGLPGAAQQGLGTCMGALALHLGSRLNAAWSSAPMPSVGAALAAAGPVEPRCERMLRSLGPHEQRQTRTGGGTMTLPCCCRESNLLAIAFARSCSP